MTCESYSNMDEAYNIRIVGSGPIALFTCWSLSNCNNKVDIISDRLAFCSNQYRIFIDRSYLPGFFTPDIFPSTSLLAGQHDLYIVCNSPARSLVIADKLQLFNPQSKVLILSTYSCNISDSLLRNPLTRFYAWPLVSVESENHSIYSTNFLHLLLHQQNDHSSSYSLLSKFFKSPLDLYTSSSTKSLLARSILTFTFYSFLHEFSPKSHVFDSSVLCNYCTPLALRISAKNSISAVDFPGFSPILSLEHQLNSLFMRLIPSCLLTPASKHNLLYLISNKSKLKRFLCDFEHLL